MATAEERRIAFLENLLESTREMLTAKQRRITELEILHQDLKETIAMIKSENEAFPRSNKPYFPARPDKKGARRLWAAS